MNKPTAEENAIFKKFIGKDITRFQDGLLTAMSKKFALDIVALDTHLHKMGYDEDINGSMSDYLVFLGGKELDEIVDKWI